MGKNPRLLWGKLFQPSSTTTTAASHPPATQTIHHPWAQTASVVALVVGLTYLIWLTRLLYLSRGWLDFIFFAAETLSYLVLCLLCYNTWPHRRSRPKTPQLAARFTVDIFVPCCGEPMEVVGTTLRAVAQVRYHSLEVYVLDDGGSQAVAALADSLGFHYLSRPAAGLPRQDAKSGNLNFGLSHSQGDLVLVLDADQVADPEILERLTPFFQPPQIGYVQTRQAFFLPEGDPFYNSDRVFYESIQLHNDQANAVISCGSGVIYRRLALEDIGGFATWNLVEDFTSSYELVSHGWRGVYYPEALSQGLAPTTLAGVYRQRFQWCLDTMRIFFWDNPLFKSGLAWTQKTRFLFIMMSYLASGLVFPLFYIVPLIVYCRGHSCIIGDELTYGVLRGAYMLSTILLFRYLFFGKEPLKQFKMLCSLFPVYALGIVAALLYPRGYRKPLYRVNNTGSLAHIGTWWHVAPHLGLIFLHLSLPVIALLRNWCEPRLVFFNAIFSALIIYILGDLVLAVAIRPRWHPAMDPRQVYG
jgi:cellulose synthase (UDP-forming)